MNTRKSLKDISWNVPEKVYREDPALSYSTLTTYERGGFNELPHLFDRKETPSLTFGSAVDAIITGGEDEFNEKFMVADFPEMSDTMLKIVKKLFELYGNIYNTLDSIPAEKIKEITDLLDYGKTWRIQTVLDKIIPACSEYYNLLFLAENKTVISSDLYAKVVASVQALKDSKSTKWYFENNDPFDNNVERFYQLKWKANLNGINYRCMQDLAIVCHNEKLIYQIDLKTSSHKEWDFYKSFIDWQYHQQARLYSRILKYNLEKDEYFKDFTILPYQFIVVNKETLIPLVWSYPDTFKTGTLYYGKNNQIVCRDPEEIGIELSYYLNNMPKVPNGIYKDDPNDLNSWLWKI